MSLKKNLVKEIAFLEKEMQALEAKLVRSMAALMESIISRREPEETEMQFFRQFSSEIELRREKIIELNNQLATLLK